MKRHIESVHEGKKTDKCDVCGATFTQKSHWKKHMANVHKMYIKSGPSLIIPEDGFDM